MSTESLPARAETQSLLTERLQWWSEYLSTLPPEDLAQCGTQAVAELDSLWPYMNEDCVVSGPAVYSELVVNEDGESALSLCAGEVTDIQAKSEGFAFANMTPEDRPRLWYVFYRGNIVTMPHPTICDIKQMRAYFDPMQASILPISAIEESLLAPIPEASAEELFTTVNDYSGKLKKALCSTRFRRLHHPAQQKFIDRLIEDCEAVTALRELPVLAEAQYGYRSQVINEKVRVEALHVAEKLISGTCRGVGCLEQLKLSYKAIRRDADLVDKYAGLCLLVEVEHVSDDPEGDLTPGDIIYLPLQGQDIEVTFSRCGLQEGSEYESDLE